MKKRNIKKIIKYISIILGILIYLILGHFFNIYIFCPIHEFTGLYCPGCGTTRMLIAILKLDFYQAFRFNPLLFILSPFFIFLFVDGIYSNIKKKKSLQQRMPSFIWYIALVITIAYMILRNIFPYLAPTTV